MVKKFDIPEELQDSSWTGNAPDVVSPPGLKFANLNLVENWTVKLEFHVNGALTTGSGFFVNFPDCAYDVVLTAAHNLISPAGTLSSDLTVLLADGTRVPATNFRVSDAYKVQQTPVDDYGAILLPRAPSGVPRDGYPFSMRLAFEDAFKGSIYVSGYRADTQPGQPKTSSGACVGCYAEQLEYKAGTEQGISGSPVWIEYQGLQTAVAIHNRRPERARGGSRGSRLSPKLLREVFVWASVGEYGVELSAQASIATRALLPARGLYLSFPEDFPFARVRLGSGTKLDVLPAYATSETVLYAMMTVDRKWVTFNPAKGELVLSERMRDGSLFKKANVKLKKKAMRIVVESGGKSYQLRVQGTRIRKADGENAESSEVSMVEYPMENDKAFTEFWFESR
ncbi:hypothetical protein HETIRDRAFT_453887 [Heterobasidion irregulare TC 32-1]|uniref:Serine protease n=1 Tax=Heterobasidion irregulare (strain TC 32-1) TaxID=747525 RepID=W4JWB0_HETIT|nr:uncharacterized protein HETIRDRAFT_453887 [Heterobasidion irregulare TC 32-1]ETW77754.1 hypothetical protein HETIRDRAFT_453887 [Heterobasidion irregulare TC 32-1]